MPADPNPADNISAIAAVASSIIALLTTIVASGLAYWQGRVARRTQQSQLNIQLFNEFHQDLNRRDFLYRLDYADGPRGWRFDPDTFACSAEERELDRLLYFFAFLGGLVRKGDVRVEDLQWLRSECRIVLTHPGVLAYLRWLVSPRQMPDHDAFLDVVVLFRELIGLDHGGYEALRQAYSAPPRSRF